MRFVLNKSSGRAFTHTLTDYDLVKARVKMCEENHDLDGWMAACEEYDRLAEAVMGFLQDVVYTARDRQIKKAPDPKVPGGIEFFGFRHDEPCQLLFDGCQAAKDAAGYPRPLFATAYDSIDERSRIRRMWWEKYCQRRNYLISKLIFVTVKK